MGGIKQNINNRTARRRQKMHVCFFKLPNKNKTKQKTRQQLNLYGVHENCVLSTQSQLNHSQEKSSGALEVMR